MLINRCAVVHIIGRCNGTAAN